MLDYMLHHQSRFFPFLSAGSRNPLGSLIEDYEILYSIARGVKAKLIVEIGTHTGMSAMVLAQAIRDSRLEGTVWTVDNHSQGNHHEEAVRNVRRFKMEKHIRLLEGESTAVLRDFFGLIKKVDLVFIDGDHSYEACKADFEACKEHAGIFVFHDSFQEAGVRRGVESLWEDRSFEVINIPTTSKVQRPGVVVGIAVARKKDSS
jgi:predicted O-methyltransferase YrrM